ncbi:MAG: Gfo/Idh/MocA family oxidoreductase [Clostridia bacterium]|nr:Gfo/Idh/MocA family oxidoreductase [Clostridia bacterium]
MIKIGLIGCGYMGTMHANCYKNIDGVELVAVADIRREKALALADGADIYADGMELIQQAKVDAIDICLPTYLHAEYAIAAMEKVKYLFVEKPVALTNEQARAMMQKATETDCQVQVGQVIRFWDEYVRLKEILDSGIYGRMISANFRRISPRPLWGWENWLLDATRSGGAAQDLHIHDTDYILSIFGQPKEFTSIKNKLGETNSYIHTLMRYDDFVVSVEGTWDLPESHPFEATFRVVLEKATIENAGGSFMCYDSEGARRIELSKKELSGGYRGGNISDLGGYYNELVFFTDMIKRRGIIDKATLAEASRSLSFVLEEIAQA